MTYVILTSEMGGRALSFHNRRIANLGTRHVLPRARVLTRVLSLSSSPVHIYSEPENQFR